VDESVNIFRAIFENCIDAVFITTPDGGIQSANPAACRMFGYTEEEIIKTGRDGLLDLTDPRLPGMLEERAGTGRAAGELNFKRSDGTIFPADFTSAVFKDENGKKRTVTIIRDITSLKAAGELIKMSENKFRTLVSFSPAGIYMTDTEGKCTFVNESWCKMAGMKPEEAYGDGWINAIHTEDREKIFKEWNSFVGSAKDWNLNYRFVDKKKNITWVFGVSRTLIDPDGKITGFLGVNTDITVLKNADEKLKLSEERYRLLSEQSGAGVTLCSPEGKILFLNRRAQKYIGIKLADFTGRSLIEIYGKKEGLKLKRRIREVIRLDKNLVFEDYSEFPSGKYWFSSSYSVIRNSGGEVEGVQVIAYDITERKLIEKQLTQSTEELRELAGYLVEVREAERTRIAHDLHDDLGQKLTALNMDIAWVKSRIGVQSRSVENKLQQMAELMDETIESVQNISFGLRPSILDDLGLIPAIQWQVMDFHKKTGTICIVSSSPNEITVDTGISLVVFRIIQEALTNITRHSGATKVNIKITLSEEMLEISIKDNGSGITQEEIESSKSFGLIGIRERVRMVNGEVVISGSQGNGTRVYVMIPVG
jgi:PAS domain S-box-containing protein